MTIDFSHWQPNPIGTVRNVVVKLMPQLPVGNWDIHVPGAANKGDLRLNPFTLKWEPANVSDLGVIARQVGEATENTRQEGCERCRFFYSKWDQCRRHPPETFQTEVKDDYVYVWTRVGPSDWCGEWQARGGRE